MRYNNVLCVCICTPQARGTGWTGAVGFHEIGRHGNARDTNIGPVPKKRGFCNDLGLSFIQQSFSLLLFNTLPQQITSLNVSFDSRHKATTHTLPSLAQNTSE